MSHDRWMLALILLAVVAYIVVTVYSCIETSKRENARNNWYAVNGYSYVMDQNLGKIWVKQSDIMKLQIGYTEKP